MSDSKSAEEFVDEAWEIFKHDSLASSRSGYPSQGTRGKLLQLFDQELAKRVEEARIDGHVEALKAVLSSAQPNSNVVVTGLVSFMLQGAREKRASLNNQTSEALEPKRRKEK